MNSAEYTFLFITTNGQANADTDKRRDTERDQTRFQQEKVLHTCTQTFISYTAVVRCMKSLPITTKANTLLNLFWEEECIANASIFDNHFCPVHSFIAFNYSCRRFFVWQWQQVCDQMSYLRLYYIDSGTWYHYTIVF